MPKVSVFYNAKNNGAHVSDANHETGSHRPYIDIESDIIDWADDHCTDSGEFYGDRVALIHTITNIVREHLGNDFDAVIEIGDY